MFEELEHTADIALRIRARDLLGLFLQAALGMFSLMGADPSARPTVAREIVLDAVDVETLLVDWLNELLYLREVSGEAYTLFEIGSLTPTHLTATVRGYPVGELPGRKIKAATFHDLRILQTPEGVEATVVFDV